MTNSFEMNFDGIVGPTHNYSGLSFGNLASQSHLLSTSYPKKAALQGLEKMHFLHQLGIKQGVLPPHERPNIAALRKAGFDGTDRKILKSAWEIQPEMLMKCSSAASMWTANAATVTPSVDTKDSRLHLTPANLFSNYHRLLEAPMTTKILRKIFHNAEYFCVHDPLPNLKNLSDEGAANHTRFCNNYSSKGIHLFVYGKEEESRKYPARQSLEACQAIATHHLIDNPIFAQQNPKAIDQGVFHNDVISVGNENVFLYHSDAFVNTSQIIEQIREKLSNPSMIEIDSISIKEAVETYLFNSQIVTCKKGSMALIAPEECKDLQVMDAILRDEKNPIESVYYFDLQESMRNGGGPACLRLRIVLNEEEFAKMHQGIIFTDSLYKQLKGWIEKHYRDTLTPKELSDPDLFEETKEALNELTTILNLDHLYSFQ